jgi:hypothetical protein
MIPYIAVQNRNRAAMSSRTPITDFDNAAFIDVYDELPLWSAPFGLQHFFVRAAFLPGWLGIVPSEDRSFFLTRLEEDLNTAATVDGLVMDVPYVCIDCRKKE